LIDAKKEYTRKVDKGQRAGKYSNVKITDNFKFVCRVVGGLVSEVAQDRSRSVYLKVIIIGLVCVIIGMTAAIIFIW